jgi:hypothetical protein
MKTLLVLVLTLCAAPAAAIELFGYVAVACGHDDPFDDSAVTDYSAEVAGWTTANHVCLTGDPVDWPAQIRNADALYRPILSVEPAFAFDTGGPDSAEAQVVWAAVVNAIAQSGVDTARIIFYLVDEPQLRGIDPALVERAAAIIRATYPLSEVMMIEAFNMAGPPLVPPSVTLWGFDAYGVPDPLAEPRFMAYLNVARLHLDAAQRLVLVLDANHTPWHTENGITPEAMANVALAYERLAMTIPDLAGMIGYTWAGGIDNLQELGLRDLPPEVLDVHRAIAERLLSSD